jgi:hypothetical protein
MYYDTESFAHIWFMLKADTAPLVMVVIHYRHGSKAYARSGWGCRVRGSEKCRLP